MYDDYYLVGYSCRGKNEETHRYQEYETDDEYVRLKREEEREEFYKELETN